MGMNKLLLSGLFCRDCGAALYPWHGTIVIDDGAVVLCDDCLRRYKIRMAIAGHYQSHKRRSSGRHTSGRVKGLYGYTTKGNV